MSSTTAKIFDRIVPYQVQLERVKEGSRRSVLKLLKEMEKSIYGEIMASGLYAPKRPSYREKRLKALLASVNNSINDFTGKAKRLNASDLKRVAAMSADFADDAVKSSLGVGISHGALTAIDLEVIVGNVIIQGAPSAEWWGRQSRAMKQKFADRIRLGYARGDTTASIVRSLVGTKAAGYRDGVMKGTRQQVTSLVRTSIQTASNQANLEFYKKSDLIERIQWSATFDEKTTEICIGLDGLEWDANTYAPVGHTTPFPGPTAHWQCRSNQLPITISWERLAKKNKPLAKKLDKKMTEDMKSSLDGPIPANTRYEDWLKTQPDSVVNEVLGKKKAQLWREGRLNFKQLISERSRPLNVADLNVPLPPPDLDSLLKNRPSKFASQRFYDETLKIKKPRISKSAEVYTLPDENSAMNRYLRGQKPIGSSDAMKRINANGKAAADDILKNWDDVSIPANQDMTLYRSIEGLDDLKVGSTFGDDGFWATATNSRDASRFLGDEGLMFEIDIKQGTRLFNPNAHFDISGPGYIAEKELVLSPGTKIQILKIEKRKMVVEDRYGGPDIERFVSVVIARVVP